MQFAAFLQIRVFIFALMKKLAPEEFKAGTWKQRIEYKSFSPNKICVHWSFSDPSLLKLLSEADRYIGKADAFADIIPDLDFFIKMHITKEATVSSKIEGTQTTFQEALFKEEDLNPEKRDDWHEVHNYIEALNRAIEQMTRLPISNRLIKQTHKILLSGVRGKEKLPGEYRRSQNWIGTSLKDAIFIPPTYEEIDDLMSDLEKFINAEVMELPIEVPHLIKVAIIHYQFETIHPFLDGNGRIGRLLITLYLIEKGLLKKPTLYLSDFFERNRRFYYDSLMLVRTKNDLIQWIKFFLTGIIDTAKKSIKTFQLILKLRDDIELNRLISLGRRQQDGKKLITELYKQPIMDGMQIAQVLSIHSSTANRLIGEFINKGILTELTGYKRNRIFAFKEYIDLFK